MLGTKLSFQLGPIECIFMLRWLPFFFYKKKWVYFLFCFATGSLILCRAFSFNVVLILCGKKKENRVCLLMKG